MSVERKHCYIYYISCIKWNSRNYVNKRALFFLLFERNDAMKTCHNNNAEASVEYVLSLGPRHTVPQGYCTSPSSSWTDLPSALALCSPHLYIPAQKSPPPRDLPWLFVMRSLLAHSGSRSPVFPEHALLTARSTSWASRHCMIPAALSCSFLHSPCLFLFIGQPKWVPWTINWCPQRGPSMVSYGNTRGDRPATLVLSWDRAEGLYLSLLSSPRASDVQEPYLSASLPSSPCCWESKA